MKRRLEQLRNLIAGLVLCWSYGSFGNNASTATIYVGRHFEVRDHDAPVKYVFNGNTRVARITGSLAAPRRIQRFRLYGGWNLLSLAISATNALRQITEALPSILTVDRIFQWDGGSSNWRPLSDGQSLAAGTVLWLYSPSDASLMLTGTYADPTNRFVSATGGFLPSAGLEASDLGSWLSNTPSASSWSYDGSASAWLSWLAPPFQLSNEPAVIVAPGSAVFVRAAAVTELEVPEAALRIRYFHQDHLGSSSVVSDAGGAVVEEAAFYPFGATRNGFEPRQMAEAYGFAQKEKDPESNLSYFEARYLLSSEARFASTDPAYASFERLPDDKRSVLLQQPQLFNLYSYALNSPLRFQDPSGLEVIKLTEHQKALVLQAQQQAISMLDYAIQKIDQNLNSCSPDNPADSFLEQWFGLEHGLGNKAQVSANLRKIRTELKSFGPEDFLYDTAPKHSAALAYVTPRRPGRIILTAKFFNLEETGVDTKAGTLIHEGSHPASVLDTDDLAYGPRDAADLASKNNGAALRNADNYEYFTEGLRIDEQLRMANEGAKYFNQILQGGASK